MYFLTWFDSRVDMVFEIKEAIRLVKNSFPGCLFDETELKFYVGGLADNNIVACLEII